MGVNIYQGGICVGSYANNMCQADPKKTSSADTKTGTKTAVKTPAVVKPQPAPLSKGAEIAMAVLGLGILGCATAAQCTPVNERLAITQRPNPPFNFTGDNDPAKIPLISELASNTLAQVPACWLVGVDVINFAPFVQGKGREAGGLCQYSSQTNTSTLSVETKALPVVQPSSYDSASVLGTLLHEVGHHVQDSSCDDRGFSAISWSGGSSQASNQIRPTGFITVYAATSNQEDFAESFSHYIYHPEQFRYWAAKDPVLQVKYDLLKKEFFQGKEFHQSWDKGDLGYAQLLEGKLAEGMVTFGAFAQIESGKPGAIKDIASFFSRSLWSVYIAPNGLPIDDIAGKITELGALIDNYGKTYPELVPILNNSIANLRTYQ
jgi:hypothetical protein